MNEYTREKQTLAELGEKYKRSHVRVRKQLDEHGAENIPNDIKPQETVVVPDTTFWGTTVSSFFVLGI